MSWIADFLRPVNAVALAIAISSAAFAIFAYYDTRSAAEISYVFTKIKIFNHLLPSRPVVITDRYGREIDEDVYAAEVTVWNSGNIELGAEKVREPLKLVISKPSKIIDAEIVAKSPQKRATFAVALPPTDGDANSLVITWHTFDPGDGFKLRIVYSTSVPTSIVLDGAILGVKEFTNQMDPPPQGRSLRDIWPFIPLLIVFMITLLGRPLLIGYPYGTPKGNRISGIFSAMIVVAIAFALWGIGGEILSWRSPPLFNP